MKVKVKNDSGNENFSGFYDHVRRRVGDVFAIRDTPRRELFKGEQKLVDGNEEARATYDAIKDKDGKIPQDFSFRWMEPVAQAVPERVTTAQQAMDQRSEQIKAEKAGQRALDGAGGQADVI